jgi:hypothetical protein
VAGRRARVRVFGRDLQVRTDVPMSLEFCGWRGEADLIDALAGCDVLYCPYWFDPHFEAEARYAFPSKLVTYLASGRPVLFHGPAYASPARFLEENGAAVQCRSLEPADVLDCLTRLAGDADLYRRLAAAGRAAFDRFFTTHAMRESLRSFLDLPDEFLNPADDCGGACRGGC